MRKGAEKGGRGAADTQPTGHVCALRRACPTAQGRTWIWYGEQGLWARVPTPLLPAGSCLGEEKSQIHGRVEL